MPDGLTPEVFWQATAKQATFLAAPEHEVLFGGAAGGGKSAGLVADVCGVWQDALFNKHYRGLLLKRSFGELQYLMERAEEVIPRVAPGSRWRDKDKIWETPAGARVRFGYCARLSDVYQYQGDEFTYIGVDELTQWPLEKQWKYLRTRLRTTDTTLTPVMRATCNPGGVGHKWVQERWQIKAEGSEARHCRIIKGHKWWIRFIPSRLSDNPHLAGTDYEVRLDDLDPMERKALLEGRWDVFDVPGSIYPDEITAAYEEERIRTVPIDPTLPVHTAWDIGMDDAMFIILFQKGPLECRIVDIYTNRRYGMSHYAQVLQEKATKGQYIFGEHLGPHDLAVQELGTGVSRQQTLQNLGIAIRIVGRGTPLEDGIDAVRAFFPKVYFDEIRAAPLIENLANYRRGYNEVLGEFKAAPVHDKHSHGCDAFRYLAVGYDSVTNDQSGFSSELHYPKLGYA